MEEKPPRNLKAMLSEAKDTSELMVDLSYAALFFGDADMAEEVHELEERLSGMVHEMREICVLAARSPRDAEQMSSVLHVVAAIERHRERRRQHLAHRHAQFGIPPRSSLILPRPRRSRIACVCATARHSRIDSSLTSSCRSKSGCASSRSAAARSG